MGMLRLFLALIVFASHFPALQFDTWVSGALAVRIFYVISGFYIQYILLGYEQQSHWRRNFYLSRLFRLFPTYYLMLILTAWFYGTTCNTYCTSMVINHSLSSLAFYYFTNLLIVGQGLGKFLTYHYSNGQFSFDPYIVKPIYWASNIQIMSQAWSISLELLFYGLAPFLLKRRSFDLILIILISFALKCFLDVYGYYNLGNWYNAFFPSELHTFLLGMFAARIALNEQKLKWCQKYLIGAGILFIGIWVTQKSMVTIISDEFLILSIFCFLPFLFAMTQYSRIDRWIGDLSYPVYLNHLLIIAFLGQYVINPSLWFVESIILSIIMSIFIVLLIEHPITLFRHRKFRKMKADCIKL